MTPLSTTQDSPARAVTKVLIVDDALLYRLLVKEAVEKIPGCRVSGLAENGKVALERIAADPPDLILLDIEMPIMNGIEFLDALRKRKQQTPVLVISSVTVSGGKQALQALERGAIDFITKPQQDSIEASRQQLKLELEEKIQLLRNGKLLTAHLPTERPAAQAPLVTHSPIEVSTAIDAALTAARHQSIDIVVIAVSTGGPKALTELLPKLGAKLPPIVVVQHMPGAFITALAEKLDHLCEANVIEAQHGVPLVRGNIYIAPGDLQLKVEKIGNGFRAALFDDPPENHCKPAADYLFRSAAAAAGSHVMGLVLTGMGADGANGALEIRNHGGIVVAQSESSCTVYGMPKQAIQRGGAAFSLSLEQMSIVLRELTS